MKTNSLVLFWVALLSINVYATDFEYDLLGRMTAVHQDNQQSVYYSYDINDNLYSKQNEDPNIPLANNVTFTSFSPPNNSYQDYSALKFTWQTDAVNNDYSYDFYLGQDPLPNLYKSNLNDLSLDVSIHTGRQPLYWRVVVRDKLGGSISSQIHKILPKDSDGDEIPDHIEATLCTDSNIADSDGDGLADGQEQGINSPYTTITNPCDADTDHDGMDDSFELSHGSNALISDGNSDSDGNGKTNWSDYVEELQNKATSAGITPESGLKVLDVSDGNGYAMSDIYPDGSDMTMMYWIRFNKVQGIMQRTGVHDGKSHRFFLGLDALNDISFGVSDYYKTSLTQEIFI